MKRVRFFLKNNIIHLPWWLLGFHAILMIGFITKIIFAYYETNDDPAMIMIARGLINFTKFGEPRLIHQSAFIGQIYSFFHGLYSDFDWYAGVHYSVYTISSFALIRKLQINKFSTYNVIIFAFFLITSCIYFLSPQFTKTAFLIGSLALYFLYQGINKRKITHLFLYTTLFVLSSLFREAPGKILLLFCLLLIVFQSLKPTLNKDRLQILTIGLALITIAYGTLFFIKKSENYIYYSAPEWELFRKADTARSYIQHNRPPSSNIDSLHKQLSTSSGLTPVEQSLLSKWVPIDQNIYTKENFIKYSALLKEAYKKKPEYAENINRTKEYFLKTPLVIFFPIVIFFILSIVTNRFFLTRLAWSIIPILIVLYISINFRPPPPRVWFGVFFLAFIAGTLDLRKYASLEYRPSLTKKILFAFIAVSYTVLTFQHCLKGYQKKDSLCGLTYLVVDKLITDFPNHKYNVNGAYIYSLCYIKPFNISYPKQISNDATVFGWTSLTPWIQNNLFNGPGPLFNSFCEDDHNILVSDKDYVDLLNSYILEKNWPYKVHLIPHSKQKEFPYRDYYSCSKTN